MPKSATKVVALLCIMYFIAYVDRVNISMASGVFGPELGLTNTQIGLAISAFGWTYLVFQILGAWLGDRWGARNTLAVCAMIVGGATISIGLAGSLTAIVAARVLLGLGEGAMFPVASRAMSQWVPAERRGWAQGLTHGFARLGNAVTPPVIAILITWSSWRGSFYIVGVLSILWAFAWFVYFRDRDKSGAKPAGVAAKVASKPVPWGALARRILPLSAVYFCYGWVFWLFLSWIPQYFLKVHNMQISKSAIFASGVFLAGVLGDVVGGAVSDWLLKRTGRLNVARRNLIVAAYLGALVALIPVIFLRDPLLIALSLSAGLFFCEIIIGPIWSVPMDIAPEYCSTATGMMSAGATLASIISPVAAGFMIDQTGNWNLPFASAIALLLIGAVLAFFIRPEVPFNPYGDNKPVEPLNPHGDAAPLAGTRSRV